MTAKKTGATVKVDFPAEIFDVETNVALIHQVVVGQQAAARQGTHATKTRGKVSGGGAKPWRQKGTGRARAGSSRSPLWTGGGIVFGPSPRHYTLKVNRKARRAALRAVLSVHAERGSVFGLDAAAFDAPSTRTAAGLLADRRGGSVLVVLGADEVAAAKSFRNLSRVNVLPADAAGVADIVGAATLVASQEAIDALTARGATAKSTEEASA